MHQTLSTACILIILKDHDKIAFNLGKLKILCRDKYFDRCYPKTTACHHLKTWAYTQFNDFCGLPTALLLLSVFINHSYYGKIYAFCNRKYDLCVGSLASVSKITVAPKFANQNVFYSLNTLACKPHLGIQDVIYKQLKTDEKLRATIHSKFQTYWRSDHGNSILTLLRHFPFKEMGDILYFHRTRY